MASIEYSLFRASFIKSSQQSLFHSDLSPRDIFLRALQERPSTVARKGYVWHIGNLELFSETSGYFAVGRTTKSTIEKFDPDSGDFVEEELETSPYTHCVFSADLGIIGIALKVSLAPTVKGIANRIKELLATSLTVRATLTSVEIAPIPDPEGFLRALDSAYRVYRFAATFHGPNPFDADEFFQKPLSVYLAAANGEKGKAQIKGDDLNRDVLQSVTRSTAATGNEASATIAREKGQKATTLHLRGDAVKQRFEEEDKPEAVLRDLEELYRRVRKQ
jgi:hypothetical protein